MIITNLDNGRGLTPVQRELWSEKVSLIEKEHPDDVINPGEYAWCEFAETFKMLVLVCPFCGFEAPLPWLLKILKTNPLDIWSELHCGNCKVSFYIIDGVAYKSWMPSARLKWILEQSQPSV